MRRLVIIESPFAGDVPLNLGYLCGALRDSLMRDEAPFASHGLYTLPGVLNDGLPEERELGISAGLDWAKRADLTAVYIDLGITRGMAVGIENALAVGRRVEYRSLPGWRFKAPPAATISEGTP